MRNVLNFIFYNTGWVAAVLGASRGMPLAGPLVNLAALLAHLLSARGRILPEATFAVVIALIGTTVDSLLPALGFVVFSAPTPSLNGAYPLWMTSLWIGFGTTLSASLSWIRGRYLLGALFGAIGGPLSLYAGVSLGAAQFSGDMLTVLSISALEWAVLIPLIQLVHLRVVPLSPRARPPRE